MTDLFLQRECELWLGGLFLSPFFVLSRRPIFRVNLRGISPEIGMFFFPSFSEAFSFFGG